MAPTPLELRLVLRCQHCLLVQFQTASRRCRRCRTPFFEVPPAPLVRTVQIKPVSEPRPHPVAHRLKTMRTARHLSQRELAELMRVPRSYVSKIESSRTVPTLRMLKSIASALGIAIADLVREEDQVMSELSLVVRLLNQAQRTEILHMVQQLASMHGRDSFQR